MDYTQTVHDLTFIAAQTLIDFGLQLATERNVKISIAIVDRAGALLAFLRMDDVPLVTIDVAIGKAHSAALLKAPSKTFEDFINTGITSMVSMPNILPLQGGVPVIHRGHVVGAVGISGASGEVDNEIATILADYLK